MGKRMKRVPKRLETAQRGLGFAEEGTQAAPRVAAVSEDFFLPDDPRGLYVGEERLEQYLRRNGLGWVIGLRELIEGLDYSAVVGAYRATGRRAVSPRAMIGLIVYGIMGRQSSLRELEELAVRDLGAWWVSGGNQPDHSTIGKFIQTHGEALSEGFFTGVVKTLIGKLGVGAGTVAGDATVIEAAASRFSLIRAEAAREAAEARRREAQAPAVDPGRAEAAEAALEVAEMVEERADKRRNRGRDPHTVKIAPQEPEAVVQKRKDGVVRPGYKPSVLAHESGLIVAQHVEASSEIAAIEPMLSQHAVIFGSLPRRALLDAGYFSGPLLDSCVEQGLDVLCPAGKATTDDDFDRTRYGGKFPKTAFGYDQTADVYRCPGDQELRPARAGIDQWGRRSRVYRTSACRACALKSDCTTSPRGRTIKRYEHDTVKEAMREVFEHPRARQAYRRRAPMVETVFAEVKERLGLHRFARRGLRGARVEFALHAIAFDLKKVVGASGLGVILSLWLPHPPSTWRLAGVAIVWVGNPRS